MSKCLGITLISMALLAVCAGTVSAEGQKGQLGIGLSATESSATLSAVYWFSGSFVIEPAFAFSRVSHNNNDLTILAPGIGFLYHWGFGNGIRPYFGARGSMEILMANNETNSDLIFGPVLGNEYFFDEHFSVAGEFGLVIRLTDSELSPRLLLTDATYIDTRGTLMVHLYF